VNDVATIGEDGTLNGTSLLSNDTEPDGNALTIRTTPVSGPSHGILVIHTNGTYTYKPDTNYNGSDSFSYEVCDNGIPILCATATVNITVTAVNDAPVAENDVAAIGEDGTLNGTSLLANDTDPDGNALTIRTTPVSGTSHGTLVINANGTYTYKPDTNFNGSDSFRYEVCDNRTPSMCATATVTIMVLAADDAPLAVDDVATIGEDGTLNGTSLLANDSDPDGNALTITTTPVIGPSHGILVIHTNGTYTYKPDTNYNGSDSFRYEVCDNGIPTQCATATVNITVTAVNDAPVAKDDISNVFKNNPVSGNLLTNDNDPDGDLLIIKIMPVTPPVNGKVVINPDGTYVFTPNPGFTGTDSFAYQVCDNGLPSLCDQALISINVLDVINTNNAPVANNDVYQGSVGLPVKGILTSNDFDPDGNLNSNSVILIGPGPASGILTLSPNGSFIFVPEADITGKLSFDYQVCDLGTPARCDAATVIIEILPNPANNSTFATDDSFFGKEDQPFTGNVLANDYDPQGHVQTVSSTTSTLPLHGTLILKADGSFSYTPATNFSGNDQFVYEVCDDGTPKACDQATVYLTIGAVNDAPVAKNDINDTFRNTPVSGNVLTNDSDPEGDPLTIKTTPVSAPFNGTAVINPNGTYTYTPKTGFSGSDSFVYEVCDVNGDCGRATVTITVIPPNEVPEANDDVVSTAINRILDNTVAENDIPSGNGTNIWTIISQPAHGSIVFNADGTYTYTANPNFSGSDTFTYRLCDADGDCNQATVTISIIEFLTPNQIFTPNGDGNNDTFFIEGIEFYPNNRLIIYNRWGNVVYEKAGYANDWDGFSNMRIIGNTSLPVGTYFYMLEYGDNKHKTGYVYLTK
jgi:gliding motility-associated-like protein